MEKQRIKRCGKASTGALVMTAVDIGELESEILAAVKSSTRVEETWDTCRRQKCQITEFILPWMFCLRRMQRQTGVQRWQVRAKLLPGLRKALFLAVLAC